MPLPKPAYETANRILDIAENLVQTKGFNGFSYADIAAALNVTKASIHYHFPAKAVLGESLIGRYRNSFQSALARIDASGEDTGSKLRAYAAIYADVLEKGRMCLCGMMAADYATLPAPMQRSVQEFFRCNERWLSVLIADGMERAELSTAGPAVEDARVLVAGLEGAMLIARMRGDMRWFRSTAERLLRGLGVRSPARNSRKQHMVRGRASA